MDPITISAARIVEAIFEFGLPKVVELIKIWKAGGELTVEQAEALVLRFDKRAADYLVPKGA